MAAPEEGPVRPVPEGKWQGYVEPFVVGDPGRAAAGVVPLPDESAWDRKDTVLDAFALREGRARIVEVRAASVRGLAHRAYGKVRQDEYGFRRTANGRYLVVCVADGVSSGELSHKAAMIAAKGGARWLAGLLDRTEPADLPWGQFIRGVAVMIERNGRKLLRGRDDLDAEKCDVREVAQRLATTVLYAVIDLHAVDGTHAVHVVTVGDTSAWVLREGGRWEPQEAVKNDGAEVFSPTVHALPLPPATEPVPVRTTVRAGEALVLMTDGIGDPLGQGTGPVGRFLADVWERPPASGLEFAGQIGFARKSFDDDRTVVAVWPVNGR
ncbi:Serine/threonine protein phosphatase PrpC [Lentzea xinjiangensis]|uniref:Serine/threonine protein phosphatase PrpC n=1 Tax=Lentzea xinjiangensis TaxID=402600 RepID=A0A1H9MI85_9PSEU|nr:protein phosphatase 2C domain-containing protein [Lentzea xinjiangensis]SER23145.1 Serine/threonine protein phosphatase PrpC [Lentzea xinjiangensis]